MMEASITPGMARTRSNRSSVSMAFPTILCRRSERRGSTVGAGLRIPRFPRRPPGTCGTCEDPHVIAVRLYPEDLVTTGHSLPRRKAEHLPGRSPDFQLIAVFIPISRHHSLHRHCLLFRPKTTFLAAGELHTYESGGEPRPRQTLATEHTAPALPRLSKAFWQVGKTGNSRKNGGTFQGPGTTSTLFLANNPTPTARPVKSKWDR